LNLPISICFVCLGNIIRSPLAENLFRLIAIQAGITDKYEVGSAGLDDWHIGEPPDERMRRIAARHGLVYNGRARQFTRRDFDRYNWIIAMDLANRDALVRLARSAEDRAKIHLLREFDPQGGPNLPVPDPYYGGSNGFEEVYLVIERSVRGLLDLLEKESQALGQ
jgi:protein-tyrosine phosphatase